MLTTDADTAEWHEKRVSKVCVELKGKAPSAVKIKGPCARNLLSEKNGVFLGRKIFGPCLLRPMVVGIGCSRERGT
jgi:hypothetical protein